MVTLKEFKQKRYHSGQSLIMALALVLAASLMLFFVFNSGRAVNQKINLVNAADAAAYSGAQITARQLNFMAYTNRAMIANEVSVGHMFSYQMEVDLVTAVGQNFLDLLTSGLGGFLVSLLNFLFPGLSDLVNNTADTLGGVLDYIKQFSDGVVGVYALTIDANNAFYSSMQQQAFSEFAFPQEGQSKPVVEVAMQQVLENYQARPTAPINLNHDDTLVYFAENGSPEIQQLALAASDMSTDFCKMMLFVMPGQVSADEVGASNQVDAFCDSLVAGGGGGVAGPGTADSPMTDNGAMQDMLRTTYSTMENASWIRDRNTSYRWLGGLVGATRSGSTDIEFDAASGQLNWTADEDRFRAGLINVSVEGNIADVSEEAGRAVDSGLIATFSTWGLCGDGKPVRCDALAGGRYAGVQRYTYLNPSYTMPRITAFVSQSACGDNIGVDKDGLEIEGWHNNLHSFEEESICDDTVFAVAQAEVFFERPACVEVNGNCAYGFKSLPADASGVPQNEKPNLFNPFWQARIVR